MALIQRFLTSFRGEDDGRSGLIEKNDATIWYRKPDGSEAEIGNGGSSPSVSAVLLPAQILTLFSSPPITLVAGTPGALTLPDTFTTFYASGSTPYVVGGFVYLDVGNLAVQGTLFAAAHFGNMLAAGPPDSVAIDEFLGTLGSAFNGSDTSAVLGKGISLYADTGDPTVGDIAIAYELTYRVIVPAT